MIAKRCLSVFVLLAVFFAYSTVDLQAASPQAPNAPHAVSSQDLHQAVKTADVQANADRKAVQDYFSRAGIAATIQRVGMTQEQVSSRVAMLSDTELQSLNRQIMAMDLQKETAGLSGGAIAAIVIAAVAGGVALSLLYYYLWRDTIDSWDDY